MATFISRSPDETFALGEGWGRAATPGWVIGLTGDPSLINDMYRRYDEVKPEDLMKAAGAYLTRARSTEVTLTGGGTQ